MTERLQPPDSGHRTARRRRLPIPPPRYLADRGEPTILGFPAEVPEDEERSPGDAAPDLAPPSPELVVVRRSDPFGAAALVLAGVAANVSLSASWSPGEGPTGLSLVQRGVEALGSGQAESGSWQPVVVVGSGGLLVLLGLLLLVPARAHRLVGLLALVVSLAAAAAVVLLIVDTNLADDRFGPGLWCAVAVPVLGVLGALKAMLTVPLVTLDTSPGTEACAEL
jgi:hypothetical protein